MIRFSLLLIVVLVQSVYCAFFDLTDVDDPLSLLWHTKGNNNFYLLLFSIIILNILKCFSPNAAKVYFIIK